MWAVWARATEIGEKMLFLLHFEESDPSAILAVSLSYSSVLLNVKLQSSISNLKQTLDTLDVCELCLSLSWGWATEIGEKMLFLLHFEESDPSAILVVSLSYSPPYYYVLSSLACLATCPANFALLMWAREKGRIT